MGLRAKQHRNCCKWMECIFLLCGLITISSTQKVCLNPPPDPENGRVVSSGPYNVGTTVQYICNLGYELNGKAISTCKSPGYWDGTPPTCVERDCRSLRPPENGFVVTPFKTVGNTAVYGCNRHYNLQGSEVRRCQIDGTWSGSDPVCVYEPPVCGELHSIANGDVQVSRLTVSSIAIYACNHGFTLVGYKQRTCLPNKSWSNAEPKCSRQTQVCSPPNEMVNGRFEFTGNTPGSATTYTCDTGYRISGINRRECRSDGSWSGSTPFCQKQSINCGSLSDPMNGNVRIGGFTPGSIATYSCDNGFILRDNRKRRCLASMTWSGVEPSCVEVPNEVINCSPLSSTIPNGEVVVTGNTPGSFALYYCNEDYVLVGYDERSCFIDGMWYDTTPPVCSKYCDKLQDIPNGYVLSNGNTSGSNSNYVCQRGHTLFGNSERICSPNGEWSGMEPLCRDNSTFCDLLPSISNGQYNITGYIPGSTVMYSCDDMFNIQGNSKRTCNEHGEWSGNQPVCHIRSGAMSYSRPLIITSLVTVFLIVNVKYIFVYP